MKTLNQYINESLFGFLKNRGISKEDTKKISQGKLETLAEVAAAVEKKFNIKIYLKYPDDKTQLIPIVMNGILEGTVWFVENNDEMKNKLKEIGQFIKSSSKEKIYSLESLHAMTRNEFIKYHNDEFEDYWSEDSQIERGDDREG